MLSKIFHFIFSKAFWLNLVIAGLFLFFAGKKLLAYLDEITLHGQTIIVPDFRKMKIEKLDEFVADKKIQYIIIDSVYMADKPKGAVTEQDPPANSQVKEGRKIYLTVNAKTALRVALPDLADVTLRQATAILEYYGLRIGNKKYIPDQCFNCVLRMEMNGTKAESGAMIEKNSVIDLVLGQGQSTDLAPIPDLYGKTLSEVEMLLSSASLNYLAVSYENCKTKEDSLAARILRQSPHFEKDVAINLGSTINVWLGNASQIKITQNDSIK